MFGFIPEITERRRLDHRVYYRIYIVSFLVRPRTIKATERLHDTGLGFRHYS